MPEPIILMKDLEITYNLGKENEFKAIQGVSMEIYPEEVVAFFGPSGCGKSTLFFSVLGILPPSDGVLLVKGENPYSFSPEEMVRFQTRTIGIIYQAFYLIPSLSVIDNVALPQIFQGVSPGKRQAWARQILKRFDIEMHAEKYPENLSGGQSQRVSVSRALVNNPDILLADEPTGNLDSVSTKQVMDALEEINRVDRKTVIIITHNAAQLTYAHRVFYMKDGRLIRTVPNPEKKQIAKVDKQKMLITEMDRLSKLFPYSTPVELKVKSIVNFLTQDLDFDQLQRMESFVQLAVERKIDQIEFGKLLAKRFSDGGIGVSKNLAEVMSGRVEKVLKQAEDTRRFRRRFMANNFFSREYILIKRLTDNVANEYQGEVLLPVQKKRLSELIYNRISGLIKKDEFEKSLHVSLANGGVGLTLNAANRLTVYFEKLLIQGVEVESQGH
jgi:ABC-type lipoprotein export system ATPase subunit